MKDNLTDIIRENAISNAEMFIDNKLELDSKEPMNLYINFKTKI